MQTISIFKYFHIVSFLATKGIMWYNKQNERGNTMYQKIKNSLFYPKSIATSYKSRVIGFIIFLIALSSLPFILNICVNGFLTSSDIKSVNRAFYESELIDYKIEDHKLVAYSEETPNKYIVIDEHKTGIVFVNHESETIEVNEQFIFVFEKDGVYLNLPFIKNLSLKIDDYQTLENIDFHDAKTLETNDFWKIVWNYVDGVINKLSFIIYPIFILAIIITMIINVLSGIFVNTGILLIFERTVGVKFWEVFKNTAVAFFPYVIGVILAIAFNIQMLTTIGNIMAFIYAMIAHNEYRRIKIKENM